MLLGRQRDLLALRGSHARLKLARMRPARSALAGAHRSRYHGRGMDYRESRHYQAGDDIRNMDWLVTARTNTPHLKVFREERQRSVILCVDTGPHMSFGTRGTFKSIQAARAAALLGWAANRQHDLVGGLLFGDTAAGPRYFRPSRGRRALWQLLHALTEPGAKTPATSDCLTAALQRADRGAGSGALIFVIADFNRDIVPLERTLGSLTQRHRVVLIPIDDPADWDIPDMGPTLFTGAGDELLEVDTSDPKAQQVYREAWQQRRDMLFGLAGRLNMLVLPLRTDEEIHRTLMRNLERYANVRPV